MALSAVGMIFDNLPKAYRDGKDLVAREKMALASTYAGLAFTRANVGYVHAIAHQFGGKYHTPHGLANAIMLPHVLEFSAPAVTDRLAQLALRAGLGSEREGDEALARKFIDGVRALNAEVGIPTTLDALREADIPELARAACDEAHLGYPVPRYMDQATCEQIIRKVLPKPGAVPKAAAGVKAAPAKNAASAKKAAAQPKKATAKRPAAEAATPRRRRATA
jgi:alcohol dehydrogenase class IV